MSKSTWVSVGAGILLGAAAFFTFGTATAALFAFSAGATIASAFIGPDKPKNGSLRPDELQINQSSENAVVPVVFGTTRVAGNYIFVGFELFESEAVYAEQEGGKGGGGEDKQQTGYRYFFPLSYGICMGPVDALIRILGNPGFDVMADFDAGELPLGTLPETFDVRFTKKQGDQEFVEGGTATFHAGTDTQGTATTEDKNHRGVCWIDFERYRVDQNPSPRTLLYEVRRIPKVLDGDGNPVANFQTRGATSDEHPEWNDANPAAVAWEVLQNPVWGKGMSPDKLDAESFRITSQYYATHRIGLSTIMGNQSLTQFMAKLRDLFGLWMWWDGTKMRARCIYDRTNAYTYRPVIQADDVIDSPTFSRPSMNATSNEIRLEFTNRENNWQNENATAMDLAHIETVGGVRTQSVDGIEIGTRRAAELLAHAILRQMAYPSATCQMRITRNYSGLQPGAFVQFVWDEWRENGVATTFWRVVDIEDDDQGSEGVTLSLMEDIYATAEFDRAAGWEEPGGTIDVDDPLNNEDLVFGDLTGEREPGSIEPVTIWEPPIHITRAIRAIAVIPTREKQYVQSASVHFSRLGEPETNYLGNTSLMPVNGTLVAAIPGDGPSLSRDPGDAFEIELFYPTQASKIEAATGLVQQDSDDFAALTGVNYAILLIGNEIFRVGDAEVTAPGVVRINTYLRGEFGTVKEPHAIDAHACFFSAISPLQLLPGDQLPLTTKVNFHLSPLVTLGNDDDAPVVNVPANEAGILMDGQSVRPFPPELKSATRVGNTWTIQIRPRHWSLGAGSRVTIQDDAYRAILLLPGLALRFQRAAIAAYSVALPADQSFSTPPFTMPAAISVDEFEWKPDDGSETGGIITAVITFDTSPADLRVWAIRDGLESTTHLTIPQPT